MLQMTYCNCKMYSHSFRSWTSSSLAWRHHMRLPLQPLGCSSTDACARTSLNLPNDESPNGVLDAITYRYTSHHRSMLIANRCHYQQCILFTYSWLRNSILFYMCFHQYHGPTKDKYLCCRNTTKRQADSFIVSYVGYRLITACN